MGSFKGSRRKSAAQSVDMLFALAFAVHQEFLFYHEKDPELSDMEVTSDSDTPFRAYPHSEPSHRFLRDNLIKQTYSVFVDTPRGRRKWHLIAYFTQESLDSLRSIDDIPQLASLPVPPGKYKSARSAKGRPREQQLLDTFGPYSAYKPKLQYFPYHSPTSGPIDYQASAWQEQATPNDDTHLMTLTRPKSRSVSQDSSEVLAPLTYLQNIPPLRRHPLDEKALMSFSSTIG
jgi:hypothetical protein